MLSVNIVYIASPDFLLHMLYNNQDSSCPLPSLTLKLNYTNVRGCVPWNHKKRQNFDVLKARRKAKMRRVIMNERQTMHSLMYSRKSVGPRMAPWETPALSGYSCETAHPESIEVFYYWEETK